MRGLSSLLKALAPICIIAGALHAVLGMKADVLLGAQLSPEVMAEPSRDS